MADTFYVHETDGDDGGTGLSTLDPWKSFDPKVNGETFDPAEEVLAARDEVWRETYIPPSSGTNGSPITSGAYGSGADPIFNGADLVNTWLQGGTWQTAIALIDDQDTGASDIGIRDIIVADKSSFSGVQIRLTYKAQADGDSNIDGSSIGVMTAVDDFDNPPTRITWDTGNPGTTVPSGGTKVSDPIVFAFDKSVRHGVHTFAGSGFNLRRQSSTDGTYFATNPADDTLTQVIAYGPTTSTMGIHELEVLLDGGANVWQSALATEPAQVFFDGTRGTPVASIALVNGVGKWFWDDDVLYLYSTSDPDSAFTSPGIEVGTRTHCLVLDKEYCAFNGLTFRYAKSGAGDAVIEIGASAAATGSSLTGCTVERSDVHGMILRSGTVTFTDLTVQYNGGNGLISKADDCTVIGGFYQHNGAGSTDSSGSGIFCENPGLTLSGVSLNDNGSLLAGAGLHHGLYLQDGSSPATISDCEANDNINGHGFSLRDDCTVTDSFASGNKEAGFGIHNWAAVGGITVTLNYCLATDNDYGVRVAFPNTGAGVLTLNLNNFTSYGSTFAELGFIDHDDAEDTVYNGVYTLRNSILFHAGASRAIEVDDDVNGDGTLANLDSDYNCIYAPSGDLAYYGTDSRNWAYWQGTLNQDPNGINEDPLFVNAGGTDPEDYLLQAASPCFGLGVDVGLLTDFFGVTVPNPPTIGFSEAGAVAGQSTATVPGAGQVGVPTLITVQGKDALGAAMTSGGGTVVVSVTGANTATPVVTDEGDGTYTASYTPTKRGSDSVAITLNGEAISGSPYASLVISGGFLRCGGIGVGVGVGV